MEEIILAIQDATLDGRFNHVEACLNDVSGTWEEIVSRDTDNGILVVTKQTRNLVGYYIDARKKPISAELFLLGEIGTVVLLITGSSNLN